MEPPGDHSERRLNHWSATQVTAFLKSVRSDCLYPLWRLLAMTGMRRGEALGLQWRDIDMEDGSLVVRRAIVPVTNSTNGGQGYVVSTPKTSRSRRLHFDAVTQAAVQQQATRQMGEDRIRQARRLPTNEPWVFTCIEGGPLKPDSVSDLFTKAAAEAALPKITLHGLRHTWATLALERGVPAKVVQEHLGHATIAQTLDTYSHYVPSLDREAAEGVAAMVEG